MKRAAGSLAFVLAVAGVGVLGVFSVRPAYAQSADPAPTTTAPAATTPPPAEPAPAEPAAAPAAAAPATGLTLSTGAPKKDAATPAKKEEPKKAKKPRPFAGTQLFTQVATATSTFAAGQTQYQNPTTDMTLFFLPRYALSKDWQIRARTTFTYEFTNSDTTTTRNEPRFGDTGLQLFYRGIPAFAGIKPQVAVGLTAPTSPESRARTMIVTPALTVQLFKSFELPREGELDVIGFATYSHPLYSNTTGGIRGDFPYKRACFGAGAGCDDQLGGSANASDILSWSAIVSVTYGKFSPAFWFNLSHQFLYKFSPENDVDATRGLTAQRLSDPTTVRNGTYFSFWLDYEANSWLTPEIGYYMGRSTLRADGTFGNPFFDRYQDMRVYLGANINIDNLEKAIEGGEAEAGVVRAKNRTGPALGAY
ncbi:MAG: hypothetical protein IPQ09_09690 [Myxococcales bacterium]|nr:hypothetical protein [Myxococcales bacterium]